ncbi:MAG: hypothetical protein P4L33_00630 [Capsulimonadaceae bacterium]|nr:hypothetical protein [Capsulimonadaceae bacterium]
MKSVIACLLITACVAALAPARADTPVSYPSWTRSNRGMPQLQAFARPGGLRILFANPEQDFQAKTLVCYQYVEGMTSLSFRVSVKTSCNTTLEILYRNAAGQLYQTDPSEIPLQTGERDVTIALSRFSYRGKAYPGERVVSGKGDEITNFALRIGGASATAEFNLTNVRANIGSSFVPLFDPCVEPNPFSASRLYPNGSPLAFTSAKTPRVYLAGDAYNFAATGWKRAILESLAPEFEGHFGLDFAMELAPGIGPCVAEYNKAGIKTICESHIGDLYYGPYWTANDLYLYRWDGKTAADWQKTSPPPHGIDVSQRVVAKDAKSVVREAASCGFSEYELVDYIWPWDGGPWWGYTGSMLSAFRADLIQGDKGISLRDEHGKSHEFWFWDYLSHFTDIRFAPSQLNLSSWNEYAPCPPSKIGSGSSQDRRNLFLFAALYHYEYLKFLQSVSGGTSGGQAFFPTVNPEDPANGTDLLMLARLDGVAKIGYEFFGSPKSTDTWYHMMRWCAQECAVHGSALSLIGEINGGGHGPSRYDPAIAYAFYYDVTSSAKPIDCDIQYIENEPWPIDEAVQPDAYGRFMHWYAGSKAFMQSWSDRNTLSPGCDTVVVASRSVLEFQPSLSSTMAQAGNLGQLLSEDHFAFDECGKESLGTYAAGATRLIYCPAQSSPRDLRAAREWLSSGKNKTLITHSFVPFRIFDGELTTAWDSTSNRPPAPSSCPSLLDDALILRNVRRASPVSFDANGRLLSSVRDIYAVEGGKTILAASDGSPLIVEFAHGANRLIFITVDLSGKTDDFARNVTNVAMQTAAATPDALAPCTTSVHLYPVHGGKCVVLWDGGAIHAQENANRYERIALSEPVNLSILMARHLTEYEVFNFLDNQTYYVQSSTDGTISIQQRTSCEMLYVGDPHDAGFQRTLTAAKRNRQQLANRGFVEAK